MKRRLRKTVKWTLTVLAVLTLVAWVGSCWWKVDSWWNLGAIDAIVCLFPGQIRILIFDLGSGPHGLVYFHCERVPDPHFYWWFYYKVDGGWPHGLVSIPLWFPFLLLAAPAGWLWWRGDGRFPENACQSCGYDLSGGPHERCPECGKRSRLCPSRGDACGHPSCATRRHVHAVRWSCCRLEHKGIQRPVSNLQRTLPTVSPCYPFPCC